MRRRKQENDNEEGDVLHLPMLQILVYYIILLNNRARNSALEHINSQISNNGEQIEK